MSVQLPMLVIINLFDDPFPSLKAVVFIVLHALF